MRPKRSLALALLVFVVPSCSKDVETADPVCAAAKAYVQRLEVALDQARQDLRVVETLEVEAAAAFAKGDGSPDHDTDEALRARRTEVEPRKDGLDTQVYAARDTVQNQCPGS